MDRGGASEDLADHGGKGEGHGARRVTGVWVKSKVNRAETAMDGDDPVLWVSFGTRLGLREECHKRSRLGAHRRI